MRILYIDDTSGYHRNDLLDEELVCIGHNVTRVPKFDVKQAQAADVVWVEMVTENATRAMAAGSDYKAPLIVRLSAMELYKGRLDKLNWKRVAAFLVEGQHHKDYFLNEWGGVHPSKIHLFPTGIRTSDFPLRQGKPNKRIAVVSQVHWRKGVQLIPDVLEAIPQAYTVSLIGKVVNEDAVNYVWHEVRRRGLQDRFEMVKFKWPREKLIQWLHGHTYLLHPSYTDGVPRAVNEAMACGLMPLVHRYRGAEALYPEWCIWDRVEEIPAILEREVEPQAYRRFIEEHYSLRLAGQRADKLLRRLVR